MQTPLERSTPAETVQILEQMSKRSRVNLAGVPYTHAALSGLTLILSWRPWTAVPKEVLVQLEQVQCRGAIAGLPGIGLVETAKGATVCLIGWQALQRVHKRVLQNYKPICQPVGAPSWPPAGTLYGMPHCVGSIKPACSREHCQRALLLPAGSCYCCLRAMNVS